LERFLGLGRNALHASLARHRVRIAIAEGLSSSARRLAARPRYAQDLPTSCDQSSKSG
jgi:hypothetical protein